LIHHFARQLVQLIHSVYFNLINFDFTLMDFEHFQKFLRLNFSIEELKLFILIQAQQF